MLGQYTDDREAAPALSATSASGGGISAVRIAKAPSAGVPANPVAEPQPEAPLAGAENTPLKGGKGGDGGAPAQPPLPPSNAAFLAGVVRDVAPGARAAVCAKAGEPQASGWTAEAAADVDAQCPSDRNNYFNLSSFVADEAGDVLARKDTFSGFHAVMLDDVGTKVDRDRLAGIEPTWEVETSPGNSQVGFRLAAPLTDLAAVKRLQDAISAVGLSDPGANGAARWARLPNAINGKAKYRGPAGSPFACRLVRWNPDAAFTVEQLAELLGLDVAAPSLRATASSPVATAARDASSITSEVWSPAPAENPVITALRERGLYKRQIAQGRHDVTCPWASEHTDGLDSGTAYFEPDADRPVGGFKCQHSHGGTHRIGQLLEFLGIKGEQARGKARIDVVAGELNRVRRAAELALSLRGGFYQSGNAIVVVRSDPGTGDVATELLTEPALTAALAEAADWYRADTRDGKPVRIDPPVKVVQALLRAAQFEFLPVLRGLARQPFFRESDGVLVATPGYDATSGIFGAFDAAAFAMPEVNDEAARAALGTLDGLLGEFAFASAADRSAALCAMLTAAVRPSLPVAPAFNITAPTIGGGKSYLASTIVPFAGPGAGHNVSYPTSSDEATKTLLSLFLAAPAVVNFDDMQTQWSAWGAMNRALTSPTMTDRVLGISRTVTASTRSFIMGTGVNIGPLRDMTRRVVTIRLHHASETPALQRYRGKPAEAVAADRAKYVVAALTIVAAHRRAGSPTADVPSIATYGVWSDMCRQPLIALGLPDPATSIIEQLRHDPDRDALGSMLRAWHDQFGDTPIVLRKLLQEADEALEEALEELPVSERGLVNRSKLGWFLKHSANRVVGGFELQRVDHSTRTAWRVVSVEAPAVDRS